MIHEESNQGTLSSTPHTVPLPVRLRNADDRRLPRHQEREIRYTVEGPRVHLLERQEQGAAPEVRERHELLRCQYDEGNGSQEAPDNRRLRLPVEAGSR